MSFVTNISADDEKKMDLGGSQAIRSEKGTNPSPRLIIRLLL